MYKYIYCIYYIYNSIFVYRVLYTGRINDGLSLEWNGKRERCLVFILLLLLHRRFLYERRGAQWVVVVVVTENKTKVDMTVVFAPLKQINLAAPHFFLFPNVFFSLSFFLGMFLHYIYTKKTGCCISLYIRRLYIMRFYLLTFSLHICNIYIYCICSILLIVE